MALVMLGRQVHTSESLLPVPSSFEVEITRYWSVTSRSNPRCR